MKKYFNNVIVTLLIAITVSSLSACASKTAASQTAPEKQTKATTYPQAEIPVPYIRDYSQKSNLKKLFEGYTEDYAYAFREARRTYGGGGLMFYGLPLRQAMSLNDGDILILFDDEDWKAMQETEVDIYVDILIIVKSSKRYINGEIKAEVSDQKEKSFFSFINIINAKNDLEEAYGLDLLLGRK